MCSFYNLLKPETADGKKVSFSYIHSREMHEGLREEWMVMIVIDDFPAFYYTEGGADLRVDAPAWLRRPYRNAICAAVPGKSISLNRSNADIPVPGVI